MSTTKLVTATFLPSNTTIEVPPGTSLMQAAIDSGVEVEFVCAGQGSCGKCKAKIVSGLISDPTATEKEHLTTEELAQGIILLCQRKILGPVQLDLAVNMQQQPHGHQIQKGGLTAEISEVTPWVSKKHHRLTVPTITDNTADLDRILNQLPPGTRATLPLTPRVPTILRDSNYQVTSVTVFDELVALEEGNTTDTSYGIAFDIGTTSVAGYLVDLNKGQVVASTSAANRQRQHGADVISRIAYVIENTAGLTNLQKLITQTIDDVIIKLLEQTGINARHIYALTFIGNTVMSHLLLGVTPKGVATAPFVPAFSSSLSGTTDYLGLQSLPQPARFVLLPNIAGYVGSDTVGVILSTRLADLTGNWLAVDVGTNGEIVLASNRQMVTCSTAAGPAFEGATISQGMRAEPGAISEVFLHENGVDIKVIGDAKPVGICGSGLIDAVSEMARWGLIKPNGRLINPADCPPHIPTELKNHIQPDGKIFKFVLSMDEPQVAITQKDISELQLGKGAIKAGIEVLMQKLQIQPEDLDGILLAGAFGSNLRPKSLTGIGMLPNIDEKLIKPVGNAAGTGAVMALLSQKQLTLAQQLPQQAQHVELSVHKEFQSKFAKAISF